MRLGWNEYFMNIAVQVSLRSTCTRRKVGALIVKDNVIVSSGYNGAPKGLPNCSDCPDRCYRSKHNIPSGEKLELCYAQHAEVNALMQSAKASVDLTGAILYVTTFPCSSCAKAIIQAGIRDVYYLDTYSHEFTKMMFDEAGVRYTSMDGSVYNTPSIEGGEITARDDLDSIDPILKEIYKYEVGSEEFNKNRKEVMEKYGLNLKYQEPIFYTEYKPEKEILEFDDKLKINGIEFDKVFPVMSANRADLEYTGGDKQQLVVCAIIYDPVKDKFVFLRSIDGRLKGKINLVQGHAAVPDKLSSNTDHSIKHIDWMNDNMIKELEEEVEGIKHFIFSPICIIHTEDNKISQEHLGICYMIEAEIDYDKLKSGEPHKHEVITIDAKNVINPEYLDKMDTWCRKLMEFVMNR